MCGFFGEKREKRKIKLLKIPNPELGYGTKGRNKSRLEEFTKKHD